ncbi:MAG: hypothetical protein ACW987_20690, partial [Candidatus Thorarchaeota archaeon]
MNRVLNGGFENWTSGTPDDWTDDSNGTGAISQESVLHHALKLDGAGANNEARAYEDVTMLSGWTAYVTIYIRGDDASPTTCKIQCLETGEYLQSNGTWTSTPTNFHSQSAASYAEGATTFTVPAFSETMRHTVTLRMLGENVTGVGYLDDVYLWPSVTFASVHGHNLGSNITVKVQSDSDSAYGSVTTRATMTTTRPSFYAATTTLDPEERYWRFLFDGTNFEAIE